MEKINPKLAIKINEKEKFDALGKPVATCEKHGDLYPGQAFFVSFVRDGGKEEVAHWYCLMCLSSYLDALMAEGILPKVSVKN